MTVVKYEENLINSVSLNKVRNIAMKEVKSDFVLLIDEHFQPSPDFVKLSMAQVHLNDVNSVYVIPAFEFVKYHQVG